MMRTFCCKITKNLLMAKFYSQARGPNFVIYDLDVFEKSRTRNDLEDLVTTVKVRMLRNSYYCQVAVDHGIFDEGL